jgi:CRISPR-associated protein Csm4
MEHMFKLVFQPETAFGDLFGADTVFGHIAWAVRYLYGNDKLEKLLTAFHNEPPFLLTGFIPDGFLPRLILPPYKWSYDKDSEKKKLLEQRNEAKKQKKIEWLSMDFYRKYQESMSSKLKYDDIKDLEISSYETTRNAIDRTSFKVSEGALFTDTYIWTNKKLNVYVRVHSNEYGKQWFEPIAEYLSLTGMGKNKSTGKGKFTITVEDLTGKEEELFSYRGSHFISLSHCAGNTLKPLAYKLFTKYGRVGEEWSQHGINGKLLIFKNPIVFYKAGSTFFTNNSESFYGKMIGHIHPDERIVQYGYAFPLYFHYKEEDDESVRC